MERSQEPKLSVVGIGGIAAIVCLLGVLASSVLQRGSAAVPRSLANARALVAPNGVIPQAVATVQSAPGSNLSAGSTVSTAQSVSSQSATPTLGSTVSPSGGALATAGSTLATHSASTASTSESPSPAHSTANAIVAPSGSVMPAGSSPQSMVGDQRPAQVGLARDSAGGGGSFGTAVAASDTTGAQATTTAPQTTTTAPQTTTSYQIPGQLPPSTPAPTDASQPTAPTAGYVTAPAIGVGTLYGGESPAGNVSNAVNPGTDPYIHNSTGTWVQGPGGAMVYLGPPGYNPPPPDYSKPSLNDVWMNLENQVRAGTLVVPSGVAEGDFIAQKAAQLMQGNPNTNNTLYYATANPNSLGYHLFWNTPF